MALLHAVKTTTAVSNLASVLLKGQIAIDCNENIKLLLSQPEQISVLASGPPTFSYRLHLVPSERPLELSRQALVKQHAH